MNLTKNLTMNLTRNAFLQSVSCYLLVLFFSIGVVKGAKSERPAEADEVEQILKTFQSSDESAHKIMDQALKHESVSGTPQRKFSPSMQKSKDYIQAKDSVRLRLNNPLNNPARGRAGFEVNDQVEAIVDVEPRKILRTLEDIESANLKSARLENNPWSDTYWPLYLGTTAQRYLDRNVARLPGQWKVRFDYFASGKGNAVSVDDLSPAEKYDLLVGDASKTLTNLQWKQGESYNFSYKKLDEWTWMGLCHGWAAASFMLPRPESLVKVKAVDGTEISFYPSDIKALATLLWSNYRYHSRFAGGRCDIKNPKKNKAGRIVDQECFDTNPGTWHMTVVNQIGVAKRSFVIDATYDLEVWNQPVLSYSYNYFNPVSGTSTKSLSDAVVTYKEFLESGKDKFSDIRQRNRGVSRKQPSKIVGVSMEIEYIIENDPSTSTTDSARNDGISKVRYMYDLELDENGQIIGGEWYTNLHPDFLWVPEPTERAVSPADRLLRGEWNAASDSFPADWTSAAVRASQVEQPLAAVVEALIELSQNPNYRHPNRRNRR